MGICFCLLSFAYPSVASCQLRTHMGINAPAFLLGTLDLRSEIQLAPKFSLQLGSSFRYQDNQQRKEPRIKALSNYVELLNQGISLSVGGRLYEQDLSDYQYPFIAFDLTGVYYREKYLTEAPGGGGLTEQEVSGLRLAATATIGFVLRVSDYINMDLGIQFGYSPPREDLLAYYYPGVGYMTFGLGALGVKGGHIQPVFSIRYNIIRDKRQRIHGME